MRLLARIIPGFPKGYSLQNLQGKHRKIAAGEREWVKPAARFPALTRYRLFLSC